MADDDFCNVHRYHCISFESDYRLLTIRSSRSLRHYPACENTPAASMMCRRPAIRSCTPSLVGVPFAFALLMCTSRRGHLASFFPPPTSGGLPFFAAGQTFFLLPAQQSFPPNKRIQMSGYGNTFAPLDECCSPSKFLFFRLSFSTDDLLYTQVRVQRIYRVAARLLGL